MSTFAVLLLCIQACLVQNVFGQACVSPAAAVVAPVAPIGCGAGLAGLNYPAAVGLNAASPFGCGAGLSGLAYPGALSGLAYPGAYPAAGFAGAYPGAYTAANGGLAPYGGAGEGNVAVAGELPVAGTTAVAGQVPIMGAVSFNGAVPAAGAVSITGQCACGCNNPYSPYF